MGGALKTVGGPQDTAILSLQSQEGPPGAKLLQRPQVKSQSQRGGLTYQGYS